MGRKLLEDQQHEQLASLLKACENKFVEQAQKIGQLERDIAETRASIVLDVLRYGVDQLAEDRKT